MDGGDEGDDEEGSVCVAFAVCQALYRALCHPRSGAVAVPCPLSQMRRWLSGVPGTKARKGPPAAAVTGAPLTNRSCNFPKMLSECRMGCPR